jgi:hypothetical protein
VYASVIEGWLKHSSKALLGGDFTSFPLFA